MVAKLDMADRIELRRFVGREFLLWLWLESELFEATLSTRKHGSFGMWLEGRLVLNEGKESTVIKGSSPGMHREAKESLLRGKSPERAAFHLSFGDHECNFTLRGETMAFAGLTAPKKPGDDEEAPAADTLLAPPKRPVKKKRAAEESDYLEHEDFYDRMHFATEVEDLVTALYAEFLTLRLSPAWKAFVGPALEAWVAGQDVDSERYQAARDRALGDRKKRRN